MASYLHGVHVPHNKHTANMSAVRIYAPKSVTLPTSMHIGKPATIVVKVGDEVKVGSLIAEQNGIVSSPVYSTVSGKVSKITDILLASGKSSPAVIIESDGNMTPNDTIAPPVIRSREDLVEAIKQSGIVGLGGAGFPTYVKFGPDKKLDIEELIINGAECEPYITSDSVTMTEKAEDIAFAIDMLVKYFDIKKVIIGIERNKAAAISSMKEIAKRNAKITVKDLPSVYPQGGEKVLVYHTTGKVIGLGKLPIDVGCVVSNSSTIAAIGSYLASGMPLVERCITVDGQAVVKPQNLIVPIGTSLEDVFEFCGGFKSEPAKILYGGPMMGISVPSIKLPVLKNTNAVLAFTAAEAAPVKASACIKCGSCANHCPFGIDPCKIARALRMNEYEALEESGVELCMECGCCSFVCPAKRPIVQNNKLAKLALREHKAAKEAAK